MTRKRTAARRCKGHAAAITKKAKPSVKVTSQTKASSRPVWHLKEFNSLSREEQASALPFCMAENVTLKQFHSKCNRLESGGCFRWEFKDGKAWIYELPLCAHESAAGEVVSEILGALSNAQHREDVTFSLSPRCDNNAARWSYEPDGSFKVRGFRPGQGHPDAADAAGNRWPNIIIEVAFSEDEPHALQKAQDWLQTATNPNHGVQQVIVIKIGRGVRVDGHRTMKAWRYERGAANNPVQAIEFGHHGHNHGATQAGIAAMQLQIPVASVYQPNPPAADLADPLVLDLFNIRRTIEEAFP